MAREKTIEQKVKIETAKLRRIFERAETVSPQQLEVISGVIHNAGWMRIQLDVLREKINKDGFTERYQNGANQFGLKESTEIRIFNQMIKNYKDMIVTLSKLIPAAEAETRDELMDFIRDREPARLSIAKK
jgi:hypothetical protein